MPLTITKQKMQNSIGHQIEEMTGVNLNICFQCKKCTSGCPIAKVAGYSPSEIVKRLHLGAGEELLESELIWTCLSCGTCFARCPMGIDLSTVMDALRQLAIEKKKINEKNTIPLFNRIFLGLVKSFGRTYDLPMLLSYKIRTGKLMSDAEKFPEMLLKGKMTFLPPSGANKKTMKKVFENTKGARKNK